MRRVVLPLFEHVLSSSVLGTVDTLQIANTTAAQLRAPEETGADLFRWTLCSAGTAPVRSSSGIGLQGEVDFDDVEFTREDVLMVPALHFEGPQDFFSRLDRLQAVTRFTRRASDAGATVCGICTGTFFLGEAGLLDDRRVTTSWWMEPFFRDRFASSRLDIDAAFTIDDRVWCAGAITSNFAITLHLIESHAGPALSQAVAKVMLLDPGQRSQRPYRVLTPGHVRAVHPVAQRAFSWMQDNLQQQLRLDDLSRELGTSTRSLSRHVQDGFAKSPKALFTEMRMHEAKQRLELTSLNVDEVRESVGFEDASAFRRSFRKLTGLSPMEYRLRFAPKKDR